MDDEWIDVKRIRRISRKLGISTRTDGNTCWTRADINLASLPIFITSPIFGYTHVLIILCVSVIKETSPSDKRMIIDLTVAYFHPIYQIYVTSLPHQVDSVDLIYGPIDGHYRRICRASTRFILKIPIKYNAYCMRIDWGKKIRSITIYLSIEMRSISLQRHV